MGVKRPKPVNYQERIANAIRQRAEPVAAAIAAQIGPASGTKNVDTKTMLNLWNHRQQYDPETGQEINPTELLSQGMPIEQIVDKVYPYRRKMVTFGRPDPQEQVKFAERMSKMSAQYLTEDVEMPEDDEADY